MHQKAFSRPLCVLVLASLVPSCARRPDEDLSEGARVPRARAGGLIQSAPQGLTPPGLTPVVFAPGLVSTEGNQASAVIYPGGREIYFWDVANRGGTVVATIYVTREERGSWSTPEVVPFSGTYMDAYVALHPDGSRLYFQSNRPIDPAESTFEYNLWYVEREGSGWSEARSMGRPINGRNHTGGASVTRDGTLYFTLMDFEGGRQEIYRSVYRDGTYQEPERLPAAVNVGFQNCDSYVAPDESYLVFLSFPRVGHADNPGRLYLAVRDSGGRWSPARVLGPPFNQEAVPGSVTISPDGRYVLFSRESLGVTGRDVFWVSAGALADTVPDGG